MIANIIRSRQKTAIGGGGGGIVIDNGDPFYSAVSMLLPMDGTNGSTTFTDSGPNAITVTAVGNAQVSTTQGKYGGASAYFDGSGDYLDMSGTGIATAFGTGDFTIEFWYYPLSVSVQQNLVDKIGSASNAIYMSSTGVLKYYVAGDRITGATLSANTWYHIALVRYSGVTKLYVNGVQSGASYTDTNNYALNTGSPRIGAAFNNTVSVNGYIDDFRISKFARYISTFTPATAALPTTASSTPADPYYGYTSLLLHMDGTNASTNFVDSGPNAIAVTAVGNAQISTTQSKYGGASAYFDGSGDYLSFPTSDKFNFGSGDFTVEFWYYYNGQPQAAARLFQTRNGDVFAGLSITHKFTNRNVDLTFGASVNGSSWAYNNGESGSISVTANAWTHVAVVRSGTVLYCYINGVQNTVFASFVGSLYYNAADVCVIGGQAGTSRSINGYIDDLRVTKYARYTSAFAPPAQAFPEYATGNDRYFSNTSLLLHMDGANGSTTFTDNSPNALAITRTGTAAISTAQSQFGGASAYFDGATGYLSLTGNSSFQFGTGDFTVEMWVYISANAASQQTFLDIRGSAIATPFTVGIYQSKLMFYDGTVRQSSATVTTGQWYHFAACRSSGTLRLFIDGISYYSASSTTNFTTGANSIYIGRGFDSAAYYTNGYIDDIRISKFARYSANFTPPTSAYPDA